MTWPASKTTLSLIPLTFVGSAVCFRRAPWKGEKSVCTDGERPHANNVMMWGSCGMAIDQFVSQHDGWRQYLHDFVNEPFSSQKATLWMVLMNLVALLSVLSSLFETIPPQGFEDVHPAFRAKHYWTFEALFEAFLALDILLRFLSAESWFRAPVSRNFRKLRHQKPRPFWRDGFIWFDIIAVVVPMLLGTTVPSSTRATVRSFRSIRHFRLMPFFASTDVLEKTFFSNAGELTIQVLIIFCLALIFGTITWYLEPCYNSEECVFKSIFSAAYYAITTMSTTGYGDLVPSRLCSRMLAWAIMIIGAIFLALPLAVIGAYFEKAWEHASHRFAKKDKALERMQRHAKLWIRKMAFRKSALTFPPHSKNEEKQMEQQMLGLHEVYEWFRWKPDSVTTVEETYDSRTLSLVQASAKRACALELFPSIMAMLNDMIYTCRLNP